MPHLRPADIIATALAGTGQWHAYTDDPRATTSQILVIDDEPTTRDSVAAMIRAEGWTPVVADGWSEALRLFQEQPFDLVVVDALMPTVDGFKLTQLLRARSSSYVPILMLTSLSDDASREQALAVGVDDVLTKPPSPFELHLRLGALLRIRHLTWALEAKSRELAAAALRDPLTGLANRRCLDERIAVELSRIRRYGSALGVVMLDIDNFKRVNDEHGHLVGDRLLEFSADLLRSAVRPSDLVCRYGGEEFVVLVSDTTAAGAQNLAERVRRTFERGSAQIVPGPPQTLSAGVTATDLMGELDGDGERLLRAADQALYAAKRAGRNRVCCWDAAMTHSAVG